MYVCVDMKSQRWVELREGSKYDQNPLYDILNSMSGLLSSGNVSSCYFLGGGVGFAF